MKNLFKSLHKAAPGNSPASSALCGKNRIQQESGGPSLIAAMLLCGTDW